jgi:hypothetical protein
MVASVPVGREARESFSETFNFGDARLGFPSQEVDDLNTPLVGDRQKFLEEVKLEHPLRELARDMRQELHDFIHSNMRPSPRMGFDTLGTPPVSVDRLVQACDRTIKSLEEQIMDESEISVETINMRGIATGMQAHLEGFMVSLARGGSSGLPDSGLDGALHNAIDLKRQMSNYLLQIDALKAGFQVG